jgi:hypothetical protein
MEHVAKDLVNDMYFQQHSSVVAAWYIVVRLATGCGGMHR